MRRNLHFLTVFLLLPTIALAHGTESTGLFLGSFTSIVVTGIALFFLPLRPGRGVAVFASVMAGIFLTWFLAFGSLGDAMYWSIRQSIYPWIAFGGIPPLIVAGLAYWVFCRPVPPENPPKA